MRVDLWADYICPWCYLALSTAEWLEQEQGCRVVWHPFELHPEIPVGGVVRSRGGPSRFDALMAEAGLPFERPMLAVNSHAALEVGGKTAMNPERFEKDHSLKLGSTSRPHSSRSHSGT